ncbi:MAG: acetate--CoA ligase family protein [Alphaproteobacteria bacterium]|nr:acetate--CoA ligase family protein [Alphaproteobacteria bacterium]
MAADTQDPPVATEPSRPSAPLPAPADDAPPETPPYLADMLDMLGNPPSPPALRRLLTSAEIPMQGSVIAADPDTAILAAGRLGYPVVLRLASPDIADPAAIGCVTDSLPDRAAVLAAFRALVERAKASRPEARLMGVAIAAAVPDGIACRIGMRGDGEAGPLVWLALPGDAAEQGTSKRPAPFGAATALALIRAHPAFALLDGSDGRPRADTGALAEALARLSVLAALAAGRIKAVEIDPLFVRPEGKGVVAADARIEV